MADDLRVKLLLEVVDHISSPMEKVSAKVAGATSGITAALKKAARSASEFGAGLKEGVGRGLSEITSKTRAATAATDNLARSTTRAKAAMLRGSVAAGATAKMEGLAGRAGGAGTALAGLGAAGLVAGAGLGAIAVAGGAAFLGVRKVLTVTDAAINQFAALNDQSIALGMSMEQFQEFDFAAAGVGVKTDQSVMALTKLNDALGEVVRNGKDVPKELAKTFKALGIRGRDIAASGGSLEKMLPKIADGIKNIKSHSARVSLLNNLFGARAGAKFLQLFEKGAEGLKEIRRQAHAAGGVLTAALVDKLVDADNRMDILGKASRVAAGTIGASFAGTSATLSEFRVRIEQAFAAWVVSSGIGDKVEAALKKASLGFDEWITRMGGAEAVMNSLSAVAGVVGDALVLAFKGVVQVFKELGDWIQNVKKVLEEPLSMTGILGIFGMKFEMPAWMSQLLGWASQVKGALGGSVSIPMPSAPAGVPQTSSPVGPSSVQTPSPGEAAQMAPRRQARPGTADKHSSLDWSGVVDLNVRGPASVARTRTRGPVGLRVNQGLNMGVG